MLSDELYEQFRSDVVDEAAPYLWTPSEVWRYMNDAYRMFVRLVGGVADYGSDVCAVDIVPGEATADINPNILRIMSATRRSDSNVIDIINHTDVGKMRSSDYGQAKRISLDTRSGPVRYAVVGLRKNTLRWVQVPEEADVADLHVYRLPLNTITGEGQSFDDVEEDHHIHLLKWMKHLAYAKHDVETYDKPKSDAYKSEFEGYCAQVKAEWERYKHKTRVVSYGGL